MFSSEEVANVLMAELDKNLDGQISFDEFIKSMAFICALIKDGQEDSTDFNTYPEGYNPAQEWMDSKNQLYQSKREEQKKRDMAKIKKYLAKLFGK